MIDQFLWDNARGPGDIIDIERMYSYAYNQYPSYTAQTFAREVQSLRPIRSRQVAAIVIAQMRMMQNG